MVVALGFIVLGRLAWDPRIMGADVGTWPIFNWLLLGYGAPAVAFLAAGHILKREAEDLAVRICDALGVCSPRCWCSSRSAMRSMTAIRWPPSRDMSSRVSLP